MSSSLLQVFVELGNLHGTSTSFIETTGVACSDSVCHNRVQVLSIPVFYSPVVRNEPATLLEAQGTNADNRYAMCPAGQFRVNSLVL